MIFLSILEGTNKLILLFMLLLFLPLSFFFFKSLAALFIYLILFLAMPYSMQDPIP